MSVLRPVRGLDPYDELTLRSGFELDYPSYELILCCDDADDAGRSGHPPPHRRVPARTGAPACRPRRRSRPTPSSTT